MSSECEISLVNFVIVLEMLMALSTCGNSLLGTHLSFHNDYVLQTLGFLVSTVTSNLNWLFSKIMSL